MSDLLPPNATTLEREIAALASHIDDIPVPIADIWNPDRCPAALLPWLAWAQSVDNWDTDWTEAQKREAIIASVSIHAHKGTIGALNRALAIPVLPIPPEVIEWFEKTPTGDPYTFEVNFTVDQVGMPDGSDFDAVERAAVSAKNLRSHLLGVNVFGLTSGTMFVGAAAYCGEIVSIAAEAP